MKILPKAVALFLCLQGSALAGEMTQIGSSNVDGWEIVAHASDGKFSHCSVGITYSARTKAQRENLRSSGGWISIKFYPNGMSIGVSGTDWTLTEGKDYRVRFAFTPGEAYRATAVAATSNVLEVAQDGVDVDFIKTMMLAHGLQFEVNGKRAGMFSLKGSRNALAAAAGCAKTGIQLNQVSNGTFDGGTFD